MQREGFAYADESVDVDFVVVPLFSESLASFSRLWQCSEISTVFIVFQDLVRIARGRVDIHYDKATRFLSVKI